MSSRSKRKKKLRSLTHKVEHLRLEVEDRDESLREFEAEFLSQLQQVAGEPMEPSPEPEQPRHQQTIIGGAPNDLPEMVQSKKTGELPEEIKKIWKAIALLTHPDRTRGDPEKTELYVAANKAAEDGKVDEILRIAAELDVPIPEDSPIVEEKLSSLATELEAQLKEKESSVLWQWGNADPEKRAKIMDAYLAMKKIKKKLAI